MRVCNVCMCQSMHVAISHMWRSEGNLEFVGSLLSAMWVLGSYPDHQAEDRSLYLLGHLANSEPKRWEGGQSLILQTLGNFMENSEHEEATECVDQKSLA